VAKLSYDVGPWPDKKPGRNGVSTVQMTVGIAGVGLELDNGWSLRKVQGR